MIFDIVRFNQFALDMLSDVDGRLDNQDEQSIGEYLEKEGYSATFRDDYLILMTACIWSRQMRSRVSCSYTGPLYVEPSSTLHCRKEARLANYPCGSKRYIDGVMRDFPQTHVHLSSSVKTLRNGQNGKVILCYGNGDEGIFDDVILACHGDEAMNIISTSASKSEKEIMSSFHTTVNKAYLILISRYVPSPALIFQHYFNFHSSCLGVRQPGLPGTTSAPPNPAGPAHQETLPPAPSKPSR
jgi:predicted NAD/FAD-binding protein